MGRTSVMDKDGMEEENSVQCKGKSAESTEENSSSEAFLTKKESQHTIVLNTRKLRSNICDKQQFLRNVGDLDNKISKFIISFDEKYLLRCLEWMHMSAFASTSCSFSSKMGIISNSLNTRGFSYRSALDMASLVIECPLASATDPVTIADGVPITSVGDPILGTITASKSMMNILSSPLLHQLGALDSEANVGRKSLLDNKEAIGSDIKSSPGSFVTTTPKKLKDMVLGDYEYESKPMHKRLTSFSSTNSSCSDQSSSVSTALSQGMLKCTWKDGFPYYVFSVDDQGEVYIANLIKSQSPDDKALDYIYKFYLKSGGERDSEICELELNLVGKMTVSTKVTLCPKNSEIMETQFLLFGSSDNCMGETQTSAHTLRKNKGLTKKVADVFRTSQSRKRRTSSKFWGTSTILEDASWEPSEKVYSNRDHRRSNSGENCIPPNFELAAIIMKDHTQNNLKKPENGGWGLKFLKKSVTRQTDKLLETSVSSESCQRHSGECSTSMDIIVPAGFHGGPRTKNGGPSSLMERWRSGGLCDCGGWDIGCPLTVINARPSGTESPIQAGITGGCKAVDLFAKGSNQSTPIMKMTNIHEDLYYIHFQSTLSALQSFSIAAAIIHSCSPTLRAKLYRN